jgi:hypothetical protein
MDGGLFLRDLSQAGRGGPRAGTASPTALAQALTSTCRLSVTVLLLALVPCLAQAAAPARKDAHASDPVVNLKVEVRIVDDAQSPSEARPPDPPGYTVSTQALHESRVDALQLQVSNGQSGALRLGQRLPVQWTVAGSRGKAAGSAAASAAARGDAGALVQDVMWVDSGQALWVLPRWPGGEQPVQVELHFERVGLRPAAVQSGPGLPAQHSHQVSSRLAIPLGVWTTFAATGTTPPSLEGRSLSTLTLSERGRQLIQMRVSAP